jgi:hypothetical protein
MAFEKQKGKWTPPTKGGKGPPFEQQESPFERRAVKSKINKKFNFSNRK